MIFRVLCHYKNGVNYLPQPVIIRQLRYHAEHFILIHLFFPSFRQRILPQEREKGIFCKHAFLFLE